ncbi:MAG: ABC transporter substrate-binding protein [Herbiconiux sp.]|uniref:ABC transporter substrate-binding protein n=1 Tax=Herbiconiux sp. TaxID=1871186 RepID=UPI0012209249|nr:ABC transporter substrate-binding protein [Herbiconiux sp.]TAJ47521.1 MAG: ABC transporter substrate-binding protein [Herbiconiux sp.]
MRVFPRPLALVAVAAASALALTACAGSGAATSETSAASDSGVVSTMYGDVTVPAASDDLKVVALGWSDAEMALALGVVPVAVYDWQGFGDENKGVGPWATDLFGDVTPEIISNSGDSLNFEQIQALSPDLILNTRAADDEKVFDRLSEIAPTVYAPTGTAAFATAWDVQLEQVGAALGKSDEAATLEDETKASIADAAAANPEFAGLTTVAATKFGDAYGAYLAGDGRFDILADLGFVQNPAVLDLEPAGFYANVSAEQVSVFDADVTVMLPIGFTAEEILADPLLQTLSVVKDGRAVALDPSDELTGAYSAASVLSIPVVLDQLVPQLATAAAKVTK